MTVRRPALRFLGLAAGTVLLSLAACSGDDGPSTDGGLESARAAVDAHIEAARTYDIEGDCDLLTPDRRRELAGYDRLEVDTYCATVTAPIEAAADEETRAQTRALYTEPTVTALDRPVGTWFSVASADGSYTEKVETVEVDGRWWIATIDSDGVALDEDHDHEGEEPVSAEVPEPAGDGPAPTTGG